MFSFLEYIKWRGDLSFSMVSFTPVDAMVLCEFLYFTIDRYVPDDFEQEPVRIAEVCENDVLVPLPNYCTKEDLELQTLIKESRRFGNVRVTGFRNIVDPSRNIQFCGATFLIDKRVSFVAFRGTDDSLIGWKENMDLAYNEVVPSQKEAVAYLEEAAKHVHGTIIVGGHSKGGNLAVYASAVSTKKVNRRIEAVYNFDGPGFNEKVLSDERFQEITDRVHTFVPQDSLIGLLLEHKEPITVIHSRENNGVKQHHMVTWEVEPFDLVRDKGITKAGENYRENISEWIASMSEEQKRTFVNVLYDLVDDYKTTGELFTVKNLWKVMWEYKNMPDDNKKAITGAVGDLKDTVFENVKDKIYEIRDKWLRSLGDEEGNRFLG